MSASRGPLILTAVTWAVVACGAAASPRAAEPVNSPQAAGRTYGENYKDMLLTLCVANAFEGEAAGADAGSSFSALRDWPTTTWRTAPTR